MYLKLATFNVCIYSHLRLNSITLFSTSTRFGIFYRARLVRMCWIASKTSTWNKQFKRQKKKVDQTNFDKESVFQRWNVSFVRYDLQSNVTVFLVLFVQKIQGRDWRLPKTIEYELACRFELFQFPPVVNWNFSFTHTHMELRHAVTTHQWTRKPVYYN